MIQVSHLTKYYGDFLAVNDLSFEIEDGHVYGFLGPNGAGKSTTMNIMTGCLSPTDGNIRIGGFDILEQPEAAKRLIGYLPEQPPLYLNETPLEYLTFVGEAKGLRGAKLREEITSVLQQAGIKHVQDRLIGALSKGYRQRVGIAQALLGQPQVIILDEPTVGLDPIQIIEIRDLIKELGQTHTVILSSHILSEVQAVCEQVLIISKGQLVAFDTPENLEKVMLSSSSVTLQAEAGKNMAEDILGQIDGISGWQIKENADACSITADLVNGQEARSVCGQLTMAFAAKGCPVFEIRAKKANLEEVFLELTESGTAEEEPEMEDAESTDADDADLNMNLKKENPEKENPEKDNSKEENSEEENPEKENTEEENPEHIDSERDSECNTEKEKEEAES